VLPELFRVGDVVLRDPSAGDGRWAVLAFASRGDADAALAKDGAVLGGFMVGVKPAETHEVSPAFLQALQSLRSGAAAAVAAPAFAPGAIDAESGADAGAVNARAASAAAHGDAEAGLGGAAAFVEDATEADAYGAADDDEEDDIFDLDAHMQRAAARRAAAVASSAHRSRSRSAAPGAAAGATTATAGMTAAQWAPWEDTVPRRASFCRRLCEYLRVY
jgi:hypothetical protein